MQVVTIPLTIVQTTRRLRRDLSFTSVVVLTLSLGIGATTALAAATYAFLLAPLPFPDADRLCVLYETAQGSASRDFGAALPNIRDLQEQTHAFESVGAGLTRTFGLRASGGALKVVNVGMVTATFLKTLEVQPYIGRNFTSAEELGGARLIIISDQIWAERFGRDHLVLGKHLDLNEESFTIIGVLPSTFPALIGSEPVQAFIPLPDSTYDHRSAKSLFAVARLKPDERLDSARANLRAVSHRLAQMYPENSGIEANIQDLREAMYGSARGPVLLILSGSILILVAAATNVIFYFAERMITRMQEIVVRVALGATSADLGSQFITESLVLCGASAGLGACVGTLILAVLRRTNIIPHAAAIAYTDPRGLSTTCVIVGLSAAFAILLSIVLGIVCLRIVKVTNISGLLGGSGWTRSAHRTGTLFLNGFVIAQIAISFVLLASCAFLLNSLHLVLAAPRGFDSNNIIQFGLGLPEVRYNTDQKLATFHEDLLRALEHLPGIESAFGAWRLPTEGGGIGLSTHFYVEGALRAESHKKWPSALINIVTPNYFETLKIPLFKGRSFSSFDNLRTPRVLIVNRAFERAFFKDANALSRRLKLSWQSDSTPADTWFEVIGVVNNTRDRSLETSPEPELYLAMSQFPADGFQYALRTRHLDPTVIKSVQQVVHGLDPQLEDIRVVTFNERLMSGVQYRKTLLRYNEWLATLAGFLMVVGLYGGVSYLLAQRTKALAIRMALGASPSKIRLLVIRQVSSLISIGLAVGLILWLAAARFIRSELFGLSTTDPFTLMIVVLALYLLCLLFVSRACFVVGRISPASILRST